MFDSLTDRLQDTLQKVRGESQLSTENVNAALQEVRRALLEADVNLQTIRFFLDQVRAQAIGERVVRGVTPAQKFIQVVHDQLIELLGSEKASLVLKGKPSLIMLLGLQGSGKTTTAAKLAKYLSQQKKKVLLVALDLQRPAAIEQLQILGGQIDVPVHARTDTKDVLTVAEEAWSKAKNEGYEICIFDTAGRLQVDTELMAELLLLEKSYKPDEKLLVLDALTGQAAAEVAMTFDSQIGVSGCILSKMDSDTRGGAALSVVQASNKKIKFLGVGEQTDALEEFEPESIAKRILGFADVVSLVKSAEKAVEEEEIKRIEHQISKGTLTLDSFLSIQKVLKKMGGFGQVFSMMGLNSMLGVDKDQREQLFGDAQAKLKKQQYMIQSMTAKERQQPELIKEERAKRIASGSGQKTEAVQAFIAEFLQMREMMQGMSAMMRFQGNPQAMMQQAQQLRQQQSKASKKNKEKRFGGGAFMRF